METVAHGNEVHDPGNIFKVQRKAEHLNEQLGYSWRLMRQDCSLQQLSDGFQSLNEVIHLPEESIDESFIIRAGRNLNLSLKTQK